MKRELVVTAQGRDRNVTVDGPLADGKFRISIDGGEERLVDARAIRPGTWSIVLPVPMADGMVPRSFVVDLDPRRTGIAASVGATEVVLQVDDALHRRLASAAGSRASHTRGETIRAPIAGKVVKVTVAVGDQVAAGTAVIVLEAMKMENELVAERGGTVTAIHKTASQAVDTNDVLVELA